MLCETRLLHLFQMWSVAFAKEVGAFDLMESLEEEYKQLQLDQKHLVKYEGRVTFLCIAIDSIKMDFKEGTKMDWD